MITNKTLIAAVFGSMQIEATKDDSHPNEMKFSGVLVRLGVSSSKAPNGSRGHKILIPKALGEAKLKTLIGMGVNYAVDLDKHQPTRKVGVIKKAWIEGNALKVSGIVWKKDFPDAEKDLKQANLGMSFEASNISVEDMHADIWTLSDLCFTGAAILYKASAAYYNTEALAASGEMAAQLFKTNDGGTQMATGVVLKKKKKIAASTNEGLTAAAIGAEFAKALAPLSASIADLKTTIESSQVDNIASNIEAKAKAKKTAANDDEDDEDEDDEDDEMDAESEDDEDDMEAEEDQEASADDEDELEDLDDDEGADNTTPGKMNNKIAKNKGNKITVSTKGEHHKNVSASALNRIAAQVDQLIEANEELKAENKRIKKQMKANAVQIEAAAERVDRRSVGSIQLQALLSKEGIDTSVMSASGEKMNASEFDAVLAKSNLSLTDRVALKTEMAKTGLMDEGHVARIGR